MDKAQKELIKSYYHARNIAVDMEDHSYYRYELNPYALKNGLLKVDALDGVDMVELIVADPTTLDDLEKASNKIYYRLTSMDVSEILQNRPELYDKLSTKFNLNKLTQTSIARILVKQPQLYTKFNLSTLDSGISITELLKSQPRFIYAVDLNHLNGHNIGELLQTYLENNDKESYDKLMEAVNFAELPNNELFRVFFKVPQTMDLFDQEKINEIFREDPIFASEFIVKQPEYFDKIRDIAMQIPKEDMVKLLKKNPFKLLKKFRTRFDELTDEDIEEIAKPHFFKANEIMGYIMTYQTNQNG